MIGAPPFLSHMAYLAHPDRIREHDAIEYGQADPPPPPPIDSALDARLTELEQRYLPGRAPVGEACDSTTPGGPQAEIPGEDQD